MELQALSGQLHIVNGELQEGAAVPGILAQPAPPKAVRGRARDFLFVHLSLTGKPEETAELTQELLDAVSQRYYESTGSVTAALRRAVIEVNTHLLRLNLGGSDVVREGAITCAVLRDGEVFVLQAGEALALLGHNFGIERLPAEPPENATPLGRSAGVDFRYFHQRLQPGDMLLLADPRIAYLPTQTLTPALVDTEIESGLEALKQIVGTDSARLLLVEITDEAPADLPDLTQPVVSSAEPLATAPTPLPRRESGQMPAVPATARRPQPGWRAPVRALDDGLGAPVRPGLNMEATARRATSHAAMGLSRFTGWLADLLVRLRPPRRDVEESSGWALPAILAIVIPIIIAVIVSTVYLQRGRVRRFAQIKVEMGQNLALAEEAGEDEGLARAHYAAVLELAQEAEAVRPGDDEINLLRQQAQSALDLMDDVTRLQAELLYEYSESTGLTAVVLREGLNGGIYTLDQANGFVYRHETDESYTTMTTTGPERIAFGGQVIRGFVMNRIVDIMWRPAGNAVTRDGLAMLDSGGVLFSYYPNLGDTRAVGLDKASRWQLPTGIAAYDERLYILDQSARRIWKYFPNSDGFYLDEEDSYIQFAGDAQLPELERATDFDIYSEDGSLAVAYSDGRFRYYDTASGRILWDETQLLQKGLRMPFRSPTTVEIVGRGLNASIFVADPGSGRIIQISRGGNVLAQFKATDEHGRELFTDISDFAIAELPLRIMVTIGNKLYICTLQ
ncbi:MAG: hypothetical protein ACE5E7_08350 [Anaerolineae bacterium]